jgi:hypothetical protein
MSKLKRVAEKSAGKARRAAAEVIGDGKLDEEGKTQEKRADEEEKGEEASLASIANNLT